MTTTERDVKRLRATQVGFTMRAYRESFVSEDGQKGLTQEGLLQRMASVDSEYGERFSHATVSRWESGSTRPNLQRLRTFGKALGLSPTEVAGLVLLAGLAPDFQTASDLSIGNEWVTHDEPSPAVDEDVETQPHERVPSLLPAVLRFVFLRCLPLGVLITAGGYALSLFSWDDSWMPAVYVCLAIALVMAQGIFVPDRDAGLREFFWVSLFLLLSTPLLQFAPIHMDHYGLYRIGDFAGTHLPYMLALLFNLVLAASAGLLFHLLWLRRFPQGGVGGNVLQRAVSVALPPVAIVYGVVILLSNVSVWIQFAVLMPTLAAIFTGLLALRDPTINPSDSDRQFLLWTITTVAIVSSTMGLVVIILIYVSPDLPTVLPDHNLLRSWDLDFTALGYTEREALERVNMGYMWHAMLLFAYMGFVVGGSLLVGLYRLGSGKGERPDVDTSAAEASATAVGLARR